MNFKFNWVLINELAISSAPTKVDDIEKIEKEGIKSILTLCAEKEVKLAENISSKFSHRRFILPDHTCQKDLNVNDLENALNYINELIQHGPTLVHCYAGIERSPLLCMAWLIKKKGLDFDSALRYMMQVNPGTNPLPKQLLLLNYRQI